MGRKINRYGEGVTRLKFDWTTIGLYLLLVVFGWVNIYAACYNEATSALFDLSTQQGKQMLWVGAAAVVAFVTLYVEPRFWSNTAYIIYGLALALLVLTLFLAVTVNGGKSWIDLGFFRFQPSEFAKFATALALAKYVGTIDVKINSLKGRLTAI